MSSPQQRPFAIAKQQLDRSRRLAIEAVPAEVRPALQALWDIDLAFADVFFTTLTPQVGEIRLAWWRERLEELDRGIAPPAEPRLQAVAADLIPLGITGAELSRLEDCWLALLSPFPWDETQADAVSQRGAILFGLGARLLGKEAADGEPFGAAWSLADLAPDVSDPESRAILFDRAKSAIASLPTTRELRPLTMITVRSAYDLLYGDRRGWHRTLTALRFVLFGQMPGS